MDREIGSRARSAYAVAALLCATVAVPASGWASTGGSGIGGSGIAPGPAGDGVQSANTTVSATGNGITLQTRASAMFRRGLSLSGTASPSAAGDTVEIERSGHQTGWRWAPTATATVAGDGSFSAVWQTNHIGRFSMRAVLSNPANPGLVQPATSMPSVTAPSTPSLTITVYRPSLATQYGPGFYGRRTACGEKLTRNMIGVANRTLKCGTPVAIDYQGRVLVVPVIDRGPYANGADWDLTEATGRVLGIDGTARIGAVSLPAR